MANKVSFRTQLPGISSSFFEYEGNRPATPNPPRFIFFGANSDLSPHRITSSDFSPRSKRSLKTLNSENAQDRARSHCQTLRPAIIRTKMPKPSYESEKDLPSSLVKIQANLGLSSDDFKRLVQKAKQFIDVNADACARTPRMMSKKNGPWPELTKDFLETEGNGPALFTKNRAGFKADEHVVWPEDKPTIILLAFALLKSQAAKQFSARSKRKSDGADGDETPKKSKTAAAGDTSIGSSKKMQSAAGAVFPPADDETDAESAAAESSSEDDEMFTGESIQGKPIHKDDPFRAVREGTSTNPTREASSHQKTKSLDLFDMDTSSVPPSSAETHKPKQAMDPNKNLPKEGTNAFEAAKILESHSQPHSRSASRADSQGDNETLARNAFHTLSSSPNTGENKPMKTLFGPHDATSLPPSPHGGKPQAQLHGTPEASRPHAAHPPTPAPSTTATNTSTSFHNLAQNVNFTVSIHPLIKTPISATATIDFHRFYADVMFNLQSSFRRRLSECSFCVVGRPGGDKWQFGVFDVGRERAWRETLGKVLGGEGGEVEVEFCGGE